MRDLANRIRRTLANAVVLGAILSGGSAGVGCAAQRPPSELVDARAAYARAVSGNAARVAPVALEDARRALDDAERKHADDAGSDEARNLAYVAHRKTLVAEATAATALAEAQQARALEILTTQHRRELADAENRLERIEDKDLLARTPGERRAKTALDRLTPFATIREIAGGERPSRAPAAFVLRLEDSVLFDGNTAELMTTARERLDRVAEALHEVGARAIVVRGFMDRSGDDRRDLDASRRRAERCARISSRAVCPRRM